jgi:replicative DNA helicase
MEVTVKEIQIPHNVEAEEAVLGSLLVDPKMAYVSIADILEPSYFFVQKHAWIYEAIQRLNRQGIVPDFVTLCDELERRERLERVGGAAYITHLIGAVPSALRVEAYAEIVRDAALRRRLIRAASQVVELAHDERRAIEDVQREAERAVLDARSEGQRDHAIYDLVTAVSDEVEERLENPAEVPGLSTGIRALDEMLGGMEPGLYILAARPSMGKTALALQIVSHVAAGGRRAMIFSLEMSGQQIAQRLIASRARVTQLDLRRGQLDQEERVRFFRASGEVSDWSLSIHTGNTTPGSVRAKVQRQQLQGEVALVVVDYLGLMKPNRDAETRNLELGHLARDLLLVTKELEVPILVLHQLNRGVESRSDKRPLLSDLRESGQLEEHADVVLMLYRDGYYHQESERADIMEVWVRKNRLSGPSDTLCELYWRGEYMRCASLSKQEALEAESG